MIVILWRQYGQDVACRALLRRHTWNTPIAHFSCQTLDLFPMLPPLICSCHNKCVHNWSQGQELPEYQANQTINIWNHNYFLTNFKAYNLKNKRNLSKADGTVMVAWSGSPWEFIFILKLCENLHLIANHYHLWQRLGCGQVPQVEIPVWTCAPPASYSTLKIDPRLLKRSRKLWEGVTPRESLTEKVNNVEKLKRFLIFNPQFNWASLNCSTMSYSGSIRAIHSIICYSVCTLYLADACMAIGQWQKSWLPHNRAWRLWRPWQPQRWAPHHQHPPCLFKSHQVFAPNVNLSLHFMQLAAVSEI